MKRRKETPPRRLPQHEGQSKLATESLSHSATVCKPFDGVEKRLSLTLDALLNAIDAYRDLKR